MAGIRDRMSLKLTSLVFSLKSIVMAGVFCGSESVEKQVSAPSGFRLKGSGWYETDFKGK
jgi:predicted nucleic acid-binding Zn ribbon protein